MEIQKENHLLEQFEKTKTFKRFFSTLLRFDADLDCFVATEKWRDKEAELLTAAWWMFAEVAKTQSTPEIFEQAYSKIFSPIVKQPYPRLENGDYKYIEIDQGWKLWQAAKASSVPKWLEIGRLQDRITELLDERQELYAQLDAGTTDGFVLVSMNRLTNVVNGIEALFEEDPTLALGELLPIQQDLKAMIEAQEQSHD